MKNIPFLVVTFISLTFFVGCITSVSPLEDSVFVYQGATQIFSVTATADENEFVWLLNDEVVQLGGTAYEYTAQKGIATQHTLMVFIKTALGEQSHNWNIINDPDLAPGSSNNPHTPTGPGPWFEGWYTRVTDIGGSRSIAIIGASSLPKGEYFTPGQYLPGYINILISEGDGKPTLSYSVYPENTMSLIDGIPVSANPKPYSISEFEWIAEGFGIITQDSININIPDVVEVHIQTRNRLPFNVFTPETGPYGTIDLLPLPLRWWIQSLGSDAQYEYTIHDGGTFETVNGVGYAHLEKNWGTAFPIGWIWAQGIAEDNQAQFVMSTAEVDFGFFSINSWIAAFRSPILQWDFMFNMPEVQVYMEQDACEGYFLFEITDPTRQLIIDASAPPNTFGAVSIPSPEGFTPDSGLESFSATVHVHAYENGLLLEHQIFSNAALEFGTAFTCPK